MQLEPDRPRPAAARSATALRSRLSAAACLLLASGIPAAAGADPAATTQIEATGLLYGEKGRTNVIEPTVRITRRFADGQSLSAQLGLDVITGASPSGAMPSGRIETVTSASGQVTTTSPGQIPTTMFKDARGALDLEWQKPFGILTPTLGGHFSREKDYRALGANAKLSIDLLDRLGTLSVAAGIDRDRVSPVGGITAGLSDPEEGGDTDSAPKHVASGLIGWSQVLTRRWLMGLNLSRSAEQGYLTEPYKVVSRVDRTSGLTTGQLTEKRPASRQRYSALASSAYHLEQDVFYVTYRYYWDDWRIRSHTIDLKYRRELPSHQSLEPHLRFYGQSAARFFTPGLLDGDPLPEFATSDYRLGALRTATVGATYGFQVPGFPGEWSVRGELIEQFGDGHPPTAVGVQRTFDLFPSVSIGSLLVGYSVEF